MGTFDASLRTLGDRKGLPATLKVADGRLAIDAGELSIGEWALDEIRLEPTPTGYRMAAEGEQLLLDIENVEDFAHALNGKKTRGKRVREDADFKAESNGKRSKASAKAAAKSEQVEKTAKRAKESKHAAPRTESAGFADGVLGFVDSTLDSASEKWDSALPPWAFTRGTVYAMLSALALMVIFPGIVFWLLLILGVLMVMFGAVVYTDQVAAARWVPGKLTPMHILIFGVGSVVLAVLVGIASSSWLTILLVGLTVFAAVTVVARLPKRNK